MGRSRKGQPVNGWLILDKPAGMTSTRALSAAKRLLDARKAGHAGTLDPSATGILPLAFGEATKTVPYLMDATKVYRFTLRWGEERDTDDAEGAVIATSDRRPDKAAIDAALAAFTGTIAQVPPRYSAIKLAGQRAYDLARKQADMELEARAVRVDSFVLETMEDADHADFRVVCGKGTYMRSLARDLARALGTVGHVARLRRLRVGPFAENGAISLAELEALGHSAARKERILSVATALDDIPALALTEAEANRLKCGQPVSLLHRADRERHALLDEQGAAHGDLVCAMLQDKPVAIVRREAGEIRPVRVLNL